jgi:hypothetical protein
MSQLQVDTILNTNGDGAPDFPNGMTVTGVVTATTLNQNITGDIKATGIGSFGSNITAATGIDVLAGGINAVGTITATSYSGDGSALTGVSGFTATASTISGAIGANKPIVINSDGTVGVITGYKAVLGNQTNIDTSVSTYWETNYNAGIGLVGGEAKFVIGYKDGQNNYLWGIVGTVGAGNSTITFGTRVQVNGTSTWGTGDVVHIPGTSKVAFLFTDASNSSEGSCVIGEVSGTTITMGSKTTFRSGSACYNIRGVWDPDANKLLVAYRDGGDTNRGSLSIGTVSGNSCTFSGNFNFSNNEIISASADRLGICYDTKNNQVVINYLPQTLGKALFAVGTISGSTATFSSMQNLTFDVSNPDRVSCVYDEKADAVVFLSAHNISSIRKVVAKAGRGVSVGSSVPYAVGAQVVADTGNANSVDIVYNSVAGVSVIAYTSNDTTPADLMRTAVLTVGVNTSLAISSVQAITNYKSDNYANNVLGYNAAINRVLITTKRDGEGGGGGGGDATIVGVRVSNASPGTFLGFSADAYTDGQTASVKIVGQQIQGQTDLVIGNKYYIQGNGSLSAVDDGEGIIAGIAISATGLLIKG